MIAARVGTRHCPAHGVGLDEFADGTIIGKFPNMGNLAINLPKSSFKKKVINSPK